MGLDLADNFVRLVRAAVGLPADRKTPHLMFIGLYPATVMKCSSDGMHCDVKPEDARLPAAKNIPVRAGVAGSAAVVSPGASVLLGWEGGDPKRPYCATGWGDATVLKLTLKAQQIVLNDGTLGVARESDPISSATAGPFAVSPQVIQMGSTSIKAG